MEGKWHRPRRGTEALQKVEEQRERHTGREAEAAAEPRSEQKGKIRPGLYFKFGLKLWEVLPCTAIYNFYHLLLVSHFWQSLEGEESGAPGWASKSASALVLQG